ncbi:MAG: primosomal protein N' [Rhodothermales bacterium]
MFVDVVLPLPLSESFTYRLPEGTRASVGSRVLVPFGSRRLTGIVVALHGGAADGHAIDEDRIKEALSVLDETPSFSEELLDLTKWMADYYVCAWGEVVRAILPAGTTSGDPTVGIRTDLHVRFAPSYRHDGAVDDLRADLPGAKQVAVVETLAGFQAEGVRAPRQADLLARADAAHSTIKSLMDRGIVERVEKEVVRTPMSSEAVPEAPPDFSMHPGQVAALKPIADAIDARRFQAFLLHGVTGSGKTEVYIEALKQTLAKGRTGIVLVPEIALTPQTVRRFRSHFGDRIAVFHSRMSPGERFDAWRLLRDGRFDIVIGPRSAILVPLSNVGLIVVDEEQEQSYKQQDPAPRYHARDVAVMRAHMNDAVCILGSATPSLESYYNARGGKYMLLEMPERVPLEGGGTASMPDVRILDLRGKRSPGVLSDYLERAVAKRLERREQVILLQNRRGYAPLLECTSCGFAPECPDCSVTLTLHKSKRQLRCHYCGRTARVPQACPKCKTGTLEMLGTGTQRVEEELEERFPDARIVRMDLDTTSGKDAHDVLLKEFGEGRADILLGTQMVAKGLDFGNVTLVGVVNADTGLLLPDFRAEERTFQLLSQVAGRAGRSSLAGEVVIQTRNPDRPIIRYARDHDYGAFAESQLSDRHELGYPPFGKLAGIEFKGPRARDARDLAGRWTDALRKRAVGVDVLGPEEAFIGRVKKQYRFHTIVKSRRSGKDVTLQEVLRSTVEEMGKPPRGCRVNIDVDPVGLF